MKSPRTLSIHLASYITDKAAIASYVSREFAKPYTVKDIERFISGKPTDSVPRRAYQGGQVWQEPIGRMPTIRTDAKGHDPLAIATNAYLAKYADKIRKALAQ